MKSRKAIKRLRQLGRPRKEGVVRYDNGRIVRGQDRETSEDATRTVREARSRHFGVKMKDAYDKDIGSPLGRLQMAGREYGITPDQRAAGDTFEWLFRAMVRVREGLPPDPPSPAAMMLDIAPHRDLAHPDAEQPGSRYYDPDSDEYAIHIKARYGEAYAALARHHMEFGRPSPFEILRSVVIGGTMPLGDQQLGNLRIALNVLMHLWKRERKA
jgi:hypothetical protein